MTLRLPTSTRTDTRFPYTTLYRSQPRYPVPGVDQPRQQRLDPAARHREPPAVAFGCGIVGEQRAQPLAGVVRHIADLERQRPARIGHRALEPSFAARDVDRKSVV